MGAQEQRLSRTVAGADPADVMSSGTHWREGATKLDAVQVVLLSAVEDVKAGFGEASHVSEAAVTAFTKVAEKARERGRQMRDAADAVDRANAALTAAIAEQRALTASTPSQP